jgi:hypothetical protein
VSRSALARNGALIACCAAITACGATKSQVRPAATVAQSESSATRLANERAAARAEAATRAATRARERARIERDAEQRERVEGVVQDYYRALNARDFPTAWQLLDVELRTLVGGLTSGEPNARTRSIGRQRRSGRLLTGLTGPAWL